MELGYWTFTRRQLLLIGLLVAGVLVVAARWAAVLGTPRAASPTPGRAGAAPGAGPAGSPASQVVVHVVGAVRRPGLYRLAQGNRISDALARAGGPTRRADLELVNLAAPVADGQQVVIPRRAPPAGAASSAATGGGAADAPSGGPVHLNTATLEQLDALPGIGPVTAQKILDYRQQHGAFSTVDELDAVSGIGPARLEELRKVVVP